MCIRLQNQEHGKGGVRNRCNGSRERGTRRGIIGREKERSNKSKKRKIEYTHCQTEHDVVVTACGSALVTPLQHRFRTSWGWCLAFVSWSEARTALVVCGEYEGSIS